MAHYYTRTVRLDSKQPVTTCCQLPRVHAEHTPALFTPIQLYERQRAELDNRIRQFKTGPNKSVPSGQLALTMTAGDDGSMAFNIARK